MNNSTVSKLTEPVTQATQEMTGKVQLAFLVFTLVVTTIGDSLVMTVVLRKRERNINDRFILNLAIADELFVAFSLPGAVVKAFGLALYSQFFCSFVRPQVTMYFNLGLFTITSMALYRTKVMLCNNPHQAKLRATHANIWIGLLWLLAFITALPAIIVATVTRTGQCSGNWKSKAHKDAYIIFLLIAKCLLPLVLITVSYSRIGIFLSKNRIPVDETSSTSRGGVGYRNRVENIKVAKTVAAIVLMFALCTAPFQTAWIMLQFGDRETRIRAVFAFRVAVIFQNLHTCFNPFIYAISRRYFRQEYIKYLSRYRDCFN
ncbi:predicted protein [Nematostella vectensis]|uniref:G-protein coupled receptors family 1 profile domain-containing protein n=1 Tax=Nematostella vectensis TaxID=45351 RepID=A7RRT8_NEMVE|nr:predicted protein [Nematostella vectensis]|eukprot:XP_001637945.1 predicted protein [Nematostella vectensis]